MVRSVVLARVHDGLPLAANMDDENVNTLNIKPLNKIVSLVGK